MALEENIGSVVIVADTVGQLDFQVAVGDNILLSKGEMVVRVVELRADDILGEIIKSPNDEEVGNEIIFQKSNVFGIIRTTS